MPRAATIQKSRPAKRCPGTVLTTNPAAKAIVHEFLLATGFPTHKWALEQLLYRVAGLGIHRLNDKEFAEKTRIWLAK